MENGTMVGYPVSKIQKMILEILDLKVQYGIVSKMDDNIKSDYVFQGIDHMFNTQDRIEIPTELRNQLAENLNAIMKLIENGNSQAEIRGNIKFCNGKYYHYDLSLRIVPIAERGDE